MQLNDTTNKIGLIQDTYFALNNITSTEYSSAEVKRNINIWYKKAVNWILESLDGWNFKDTTATASLVANQQAYTFNIANSSFSATDVLKIERVDITYDGTNWYKAEPLNRADYLEAINQTNINNDFSTTTPFYDISNNAINLYPVPVANSASGLKVTYTQQITDLSADADVPVIPENFQRILSLGAAYDWAMSRGLATAGALRNEIEQLHQEIKSFYSNRQMDSNPSVSAMVKNYN